MHARIFTHISRAHNVYIIITIFIKVVQYRLYLEISKCDLILVNTIYIIIYLSIVLTALLLIIVSELYIVKL